MNVRELKAFELKSLLALYRHLDLADDPASDLDTIEAIWQELRVSPYHKYFGAFFDGQLVSCCALTLTPNLTGGCRPYGLIENVVTHSAHRRQGFAKAVLEKALDFSWSHRCNKVMLMTDRYDDATLRFCKSAGFEPGERHAFIAVPSDQSALPTLQVLLHQ